MKLMHLILSVAVCYSSLVPLNGQDNYSLWPRRPEELEQARLLLSRQKWGEAVYILQPYVFDDGVSGREARKIVSRVNIVRYLSRMHPASAIYVVKSGDTLPKIAAQTKCPVDLLMLYNGVVDPSALKVGQRLVYINMKLRIEIYPQLNEVTVWDGNILVASYDILSRKGSDATDSDLSEVHVTSREAYIQGKRIPRHAAQSIIADKRIRLSNGLVISASATGEGRAIVLARQDVNELALLIREENRVKCGGSPNKQ